MIIIIMREEAVADGNRFLPPQLSMKNFALSSEFWVRVIITIDYFFTVSTFYKS